MNVLQEKMLREEVERLRNQVIDARALLALALDTHSGQIVVTDAALAAARLQRRVAFEPCGKGMRYFVVSASDFEDDTGSPQYPDVDPANFHIDPPMAAKVARVVGTEVHFETAWNEKFVLYLQGHGLKVGDEVPVDRDIEQGSIRGVKTKNAMEGHANAKKRG